jgi:Flp pilus assembly protein CpaB
MNRLTRVHRRVRRTVLARRRPLAALAAAAAVAAGLQAAAEPVPPKTLVLAAARDLPSGSVISSSDLDLVEFDPASVPTGTVSAAEAVGRTTAAPVRAGEPLTDVRLVAGSMLAAYPGMVAAPVRIGDAGAVDLLRVGDRIDVLAADPAGSAEADVVADDAPVIALPRQSRSSSGAQPGGLVVLAIPHKTAQTIAAAGVSHYLSIVVNH